MTACNGKCYLSKQLKKTAEDKTSPDKSMPEIEYEKTPLIFHKSRKLVLGINKDLKKSQFNDDPFFAKKVFIAPPTPPPEC